MTVLESCFISQQMDPKFLVSAADPQSSSLLQVNMGRYIHVT